MQALRWTHACIGQLTLQTGVQQAHLRQRQPELNGHARRQCDRPLNMGLVNKHQVLLLRAQCHLVARELTGKFNRLYLTQQRQNWVIGQHIG